jgi:hypothetical protein
VEIYEIITIYKEQEDSPEKEEGFKEVGKLL